MTSIETSKKNFEKKVCLKLQDRRVRQQLKYKLRHLIRTADIERVFSKSDPTKWSYKFYTVTKVIHDGFRS